MNIGQISNTPDKPTPVAERGAPIALQPAAVRNARSETVSQAAEVEKAKPAPSEEQVAHALTSINTVLQVRSPDLEFSVDSDSARTIVKVIDTKTQEVIRQMPSVEVLEIAKALDRLQSLLIRQKA